MLDPRITLPRDGVIAVECPGHGPMPWAGDAWRCGGPGCETAVTEADMARLARWLGGESTGPGRAAAVTPG